MSGLLLDRLDALADLVQLRSRAQLDAHHARTWVAWGTQRRAVQLRLRQQAAYAVQSGPIWSVLVYRVLGYSLDLLTQPGQVPSSMLIRIIFISLARRFLSSTFQMPVAR